MKIIIMFNLIEFTTQCAQENDISDEIIQKFVPQNLQDLQYKISLSVYEFVENQKMRKNRNFIDDEENDYKTALLFEKTCPSIQRLRECCHIYSQGAKKDTQCRGKTLSGKTYCQLHCPKANTLKSVCATQQRKNTRNKILDLLIKEITSAKAWETSTDCYIRKLTDIEETHCISRMLKEMKKMNT